MKVTRKQTEVEAYVWNGNESSAIATFGSKFDINFNGGKLMLSSANISIEANNGDYIVTDEVGRLFVVSNEVADKLFKISKIAHDNAKNSVNQAKSDETRNENDSDKSNLDILTEKSKKGEL